MIIGFWYALAWALMYVLVVDRKREICLVEGMEVYSFLILEAIPSW